jgi:hypothetical protein
MKWRNGAQKCKNVKIIKLVKLANFRKADNTI